MNPRVGRLSSRTSNSPRNQQVGVGAVRVYAVRHAEPGLQQPGLRQVLVPLDVRRGVTSKPGTVIPSRTASRRPVRAASAGQASSR
jgi:hypothetical protein